MITRIQKWGNSLALRIPKPFADAAGLDQNSPVEITFADGKIVVSPVSEPAYSLEGLLSQVTDDNLHGETDTGVPVGRESW
ncbi:MAG: AbrB/MazE/SpoVT family DNA-binding domain-containing protein [Anaerolineae bacterium]|nr:AbrB/MazE/SpoVT family DNA-binding domain-containing protein [Anaerolineae bacterium]